MKEKIFISGIAGFLGSHLADEFIKDGYEVGGCDNLIGGYIENVPKNVEFHIANCEDLDKMTEITKKYDIIYHCAAIAYEGLSVVSPTLITNNIVGSTISLVTAAIRNKIQRFILTSSMARYGMNEIPFREDMIPKPQDPYGISKYSAELLLHNLAEIYNLDYVIAVPHNIIGPRQKYNDPYRNVASIMINLMLQNRQPIIYGTGEQLRCFSFVQDDVIILKKLAFASNVSKEVINIGPDKESITINKLAETIAQLLNFDLHPIYVEQRPQEVKLAICSSDKARKILNYECKTSLRDGLISIIEYIKNKGTKPFEYHLDLEIINNKTPKTWKDRLF